MVIPWRFVATRLGWYARFAMVGAHPRLMICHPRHGTRLTGADVWKRAVCVSLCGLRQRSVQRLHFGSMRRRYPPRRSGKLHSQTPDTDAEPT